MAAATIPCQLAKDLTDTLARLRWSRVLDPRHFVSAGQRHSACEVCTGEARLDWLINRIPRGEPHA